MTKKSNPVAALLILFVSLALCSADENISEGTSKYCIACGIPKTLYKKRHNVHYSIPPLCICDCSTKIFALPSCTCHYSFSECVSRQEFEYLKNDLHYWQNVTLTIITNDIECEKGGSLYRMVRVCTLTILCVYFIAKDEDCRDKVGTLQREIESFKTYLNASFNELLRAVEPNSSPSTCKCDICLSIISLL